MYKKYLQKYARNTKAAATTTANSFQNAPIHVECARVCVCCSREHQNNFLAINIKKSDARSSIEYCKNLLQYTIHVDVQLSYEAPFSIHIYIHTSSRICMHARMSTSESNVYFMLIGTNVPKCQDAIVSLMPLKPPSPNHCT